MPVVTCLHCQRSLKVPEDGLGKTFRCPSCGNVFVAAIPTSEPSPATDPAGTATAAETGITTSRKVRGSGEDFDQGEEKPRPRFEPIEFHVLIRKDPERKLRRIFQGRLTRHGLVLRQGKLELEIPVGSAVKYLGDNRLRVPLEDRMVEIQITRQNLYVYRLCADMADFLNGQKRTMSVKNYRMPWYLVGLAALPLGMVVAGIAFQIFGPGVLTGILNGGLWGGLGGGLAAACWFLIQRERWPLAGRIAACLGLSVAGYSVLIITGLLVRFGGLAESEWQAFSPPGGLCSVQMPGKPRFQAQQMPTPVGPIDLKMHLVERKHEDITFALAFCDYPAGAIKGNVQAAFDGVQEGAARNVQGRVVNQRPIDLQGFAGREVEIQAPGKGTVVVRYVIVRNRLYQLMVAGRWVRPGQVDVQRFFFSFQLQEAAAPGAKQAPDGLPAPPPDASPLPAPDPAHLEPPRLLKAPLDPTAIPGLVAYWAFDEGHGAFAAAMPDKGLKATLMADWCKGVKGSALWFNGRKHFVDLGGDGRFNFGAKSDFTVAGWVAPFVDNGVIVSFRKRSAGAPVLDVLIKNGRLHADVRGDGREFGEAAVEGGQVSRKQWHHFAVVRENDGAVLLYLDGRSQARGSGPNSAGPITTDLRALGCERYWVIHHNSRSAPFLAGALDEFCIFSRALAAQEIAGLAGR
jgi:hypothetical protein